MSNQSKRPLDDFPSGTCHPLLISQKRPPRSLQWEPPGSRYSALKPSMPPLDTTTPSQPQPESFRTPTQHTKNPDLLLIPGSEFPAFSTTPQAQQSGYSSYLPHKDIGSSSSKPGDENNDWRRHPAGSQVPTQETTRNEHNNSATSNAHDDQTLCEADTNTYITGLPNGQTATPKYEPGLDTDYCCSYEPTGPGRRIYSFYEAPPEKGYKTVVLTLWADHDPDSGTIGFSVAPVFPCQVTMPGNDTGVPTIEYHGWDQARNRDKAFDAANRLLHNLHSDEYIYRRLAKDDAEKATGQDTKNFMQTLNHLAHKENTDKFEIDDASCRLRFRRGTEPPSKWTAGGHSEGGSLYAYSKTTRLEPRQAKSLLNLLSKALTESQPPPSCPTGRIGNVIVYNPQGPTAADLVPDP